MSAAAPRRVGVVGGGLVGMSWAALFAAQGREAVVQDPRSEAEAALRAFVADAWGPLTALGLTSADRPPEIAFSTDLAALRDVDFVQENGPDRIEIKRAIVAGLEAVIADDVPIASSTSSLLASDIQAGARAPGRILVAHPMNPPHMLPLVELVAGGATDPAAMDAAEAFYADLGRVTVRLRREAVGHLANRLTSALYREAVHIAAEGLASVADIDRAIAHGPGLRWALMGPHLIYHLGGGAGGYRGYLDHLGPTQERRWATLGAPVLSEAVKDLLVAGVDAELAGEDAAALARRRDAALAEMLAVKARHGF